MLLASFVEARSYIRDALPTTPTGTAMSEVGAQSSTTLPCLCADLMGIFTSDSLI